MRVYCTLSDKTYLCQGKALLSSLRRVSSEPFILYYLCLDIETYTELKGLKNVCIISLDEVEKSRKGITEYKSKVKYNEYCWSLASTFCRFLLEYRGEPNVLYIDSDIFFYQDPKIIFEEQQDKSIGIIRHRHNTSKSPDGEYNVGIIYFKNNTEGLACLRWWNDCVLKGNRPDLATCGDQKYLEEFSSRYPTEVQVLDKTFAHGAPWNFRLYVYDHFFQDGTVVWGDYRQLLVFNHFSKFVLDGGQISPTNGQYADHTLNFQVFNIPEVRQMYLEYAGEVSS